jgi:hypothetical protein
MLALVWAEIGFALLGGSAPTRRHAGWALIRSAFRDPSQVLQGSLVSMLRAAKTVIRSRVAPSSS